MKGKQKHPPSDDSIIFSESGDPTSFARPKELPMRSVHPKSFPMQKNYKQAHPEQSSSKFSEKLIFGSEMGDKKM
uniref:Uncharacterized protein n=1 Tax=Romanomermis culicivorax TaxID=13658 RepID=A0A915KBI2_ROMCU